MPLFSCYSLLSSFPRCQDQTSKSVPSHSSKSSPYLTPWSGFLLMPPVSLWSPSVHLIWGPVHSGVWSQIRVLSPRGQRVHFEVWCLQSPRVWRQYLWWNLQTGPSVAWLLCLHAALFHHGEQPCSKRSPEKFTCLLNSLQHEDTSLSTGRPPLLLA